MKKRGISENLLDQAYVIHPTLVEDVRPSLKVKNFVHANKQLVNILKQRGYPFVDVDPAYQVEINYDMSLGSNMGIIIPWDILMAVPSVFLPVPILGNYTWELNIKITDGVTGTELSQIKEKFDYSLTGYSLWGYMGAIMYARDDIFAVAAMLIDEDLKWLHAKK